jgi:flagellar basal body-associated protein FliL
MDGLIQPNLNPTTERQESGLRPILIGIVIVGAVVGILALIFRAEQKKPAVPPAYAANLKFSDMKTSAAQNFVGATVSYIDGIITNTGDRAVSHAVVQITFKDELGQTAQREELPIRVLRTGGPYDEAVDLNLSPLAPGQSKPFRLTFENISAQWNHAYPELQITQVSTK